MTDHALTLASTLGLRPPGNADLPFMIERRRNPAGHGSGRADCRRRYRGAAEPQGSFSRRRRSSNAPPLPGGLGHASGPQGYRGNSSLHSRPVHGFSVRSTWSRRTSRPRQPSVTRHPQLRRAAARPFARAATIDFKARRARFRFGRESLRRNSESAIGRPPALGEEGINRWPKVAASLANFKARRSMPALSPRRRAREPPFSSPVRGLAAGIPESGPDRWTVQRSPKSRPSRSSRLGAPRADRRHRPLEGRCQSSVSVRLRPSLRHPLRVESRCWRCWRPGTNHRGGRGPAGGRAISERGGRRAWGRF
jgi:hypothetical protein